MYTLEFLCRVRSSFSSSREWYSVVSSVSSSYVYLRMCHSKSIDLTWWVSQDERLSPWIFISIFLRCLGLEQRNTIICHWFVLDSVVSILLMGLLPRKLNPPRYKAKRNKNKIFRIGDYTIKRQHLNNNYSKWIEINEIKIKNGNKILRNIIRNFY